LLILRDAYNGIRRFNAIQKNLGIPRNILTARLRMLVDRDILSIAPASDGSVYSEYVLTERGRDLVPVLLALRQWGERHASAIEGTTMAELLDDVSRGRGGPMDAGMALARPAGF
jgi:DNA-binding HxlR family transcriptional regulator